MSWNQILPNDFAEQYNTGQLREALIIDVREPLEWQHYHLEHSLHIPMRQIPQRLDNIPQDRDLYIVCAHGVRSEVISHFLSEHQFSKVNNVMGGLAAVSAYFGFDYD